MLITVVRANGRQYEVTHHEAIQKIKLGEARVEGDHLVEREDGRPCWWNGSGWPGGMRRPGELRS